MIKRSNLKLLTLIVILSVGLVFPSNNIRAEEAYTRSTESNDESNVSLADDEAEAPYFGCNSELDNVIFDNAESIDSGGACGEAVTWDLTGGTLTISGTGDMVDYDSKEDAPWYNDRASIKTIIISEGITSIGTYSFVGCSNLKEVKFPSTLTELGAISFLQCTSLERIDIPDSITEIPYGAFAECSSLKEINANNIQIINKYGFERIGAESFTIGKTVTTIVSGAFLDSNVKNFYVEEGNTVFTARDGILFADGGKTLVLYPSVRTDSSYTVPSDVTHIYDTAFAYNTNLKSIDLANVKSLGESAFQGCGLETVVLPDSITSVGYFTFYGCENLVSVKFGKGLKKTSYEMFEKCTALKNIDFGGVEVLDARTFAYCSALETVTLSETVKVIDNGCFGECYALHTVTTKNLSVIPFQAFINCTSLENLNLNEGITDINRGSFHGCSKLKAVTLPGSVRYVASVAFPSDTEITNKNPLLKPFGINGYRCFETVKITGTRNYDYAYEVLKLVNEERTKYGLSPVYMQDELLEVAMDRATETSLLFSHTRPNSMDCFSISGLLLAENVASGQPNPEEVMESWMTSDEHMENILTEEFSTIGIGCFEINGVYYWTQCFGLGSETSDAIKPSNKTVTESIDITVGSFIEEIESSGVMWGDPTEYTFKLVIDASSKMNVGETKKAKVYILNPGNYLKTEILNDDLIWSSSNSSIATVSGGNIKCLKDEEVKITCKTKDGEIEGSITINGKTPSSGGTSGSGTVYPGDSDTDEDEVDPTDPSNPSYDLEVPELTYRTHVQSFGWQDWRSNGQMSGTSGLAKRLEGIEIKLDSDNVGIRYKTHVQSYGWQDWKYDGEMSGTHGQAKRLEAICIELTGPDRNKYDIYYRVHAQTYGWLGWAKNGQQAGTAGQAKRLEGIEVRIVPKGMVPSGLQGYSFVELGKTAKNASDAGIVNYMTHVQSYGDQSYVYDGSVSGTSGEAKRLEGIRININNDLSGVDGGITYQTHVQSYGWLDWTSDGEFNGTHGKAKRLEAIRIKLTGDMEYNYDVYYRVHSQTFGWLGWAKNGEAAGTEGYAKRLEGIQIVVLPKGSAAPTAPGSQTTPYIKK